MTAVDFIDPSASGLGAALERDLAEFGGNVQNAGITVVIEGVEAHPGGDSYSVRVETPDRLPRYPDLPSDL